MTSAWQIRSAPSTSWRSPDALKNLYLNTSVQKPTVIPDGSVLVRMRAAAINARDVMVIAHDPIYPLKNVEGLVPCVDGAGEVEAVGMDSIWKVGDRVMIVPHDPESDNAEEQATLEGWRGKGAGSVQGTLTQYSVYKDSHLIKAPSHLDFPELASILAAAGTAANSLFFGPQKVEKGMTVLAQGTGGVSCFAIQLAAAAGAIVIATSSSDAKLELAKHLGATHTINYTTFPSWEKEVLRLTGGKGVDHVVEVAGAGTIEQSLECTKRGGLVSLVGILTESKLTDLVPAMIFGAKTVRGVFAFKKEHCQYAVDIFEEQKLHPYVGRVFEWEEAVEAFRVSIENSVVGKIVIKI